MEHPANDHQQDLQHSDLWTGDRQHESRQLVNDRNSARDYTGLAPEACDFFEAAPPPAVPFFAEAPEEIEASDSIIAS